MTTAPPPVGSFGQPTGGRVSVGELLRLQAFDVANRLHVPGRARWWFERAETTISARVQFRSATLGRNVRLHGRLILHNDGDVAIGDGVVFFGGITPTEIHCRTNSSVRIGARSSFNYGSSLVARGTGIEIGERCLIASRVLIMDLTDDASGRVIIEDHVWLAHGVTVLPGVRIGRGSAVAAGSVVSQNVPPHSLAVGAPARCVPLTALNSS